jgi:hypothetical protein
MIDDVVFWQQLVAKLARQRTPDAIIVSMTAIWLTAL